jgi:hypothetical protein
MTYLRYLCLLAHSGVFFILSVFVLCLVYAMLPDSQEYPFFDCHFGGFY